MFRHSAWDAILVVLAFVHGTAFVLAPSIALIAMGIWWNSNTIAHNFLHLPFFRRRIVNQLFSGYLSLLLGIPQRLWRDRHRAHHAGIRWRFRWSRQLLVESTLIGMLWAGLFVLVPRFFVSVYLPGLAIGLSLCWLQGRYEHIGGTVSHYGRIYNFLFFNDGYHVEHHAHPGEHWRRLPQRHRGSANGSRWPAVLRWLEIVSLDSLETFILRIPVLQKWILKKHERGLRALMPMLPPIQRIGIVGGGLFPRTALILQRTVPNAEITIIDANKLHLEMARTFLNGRVSFVHEFFEASSIHTMDLIVIPLSFRGDLDAIYQKPNAPAILIHDWIWRKRGPSAIVSWLLLKRMNLVLR